MKTHKKKTIAVTVRVNATTEAETRRKVQKIVKAVEGSSIEAEVVGAEALPDHYDN